jgi:DNA-binding transcriptional MerR regulator
MPYTVKQVATLSGVSVRTLHHYDAIGLLKPMATSPAGYRLYGDGDLERLQTILFFRELEFALPDIKAILDHPGFDRKEALIAHRRLLLEKQQRLTGLVGTIDRTIEAMERGKTMDAKVMFEGFDDAQIEAYRQEARERWNPEMVDESYRRWNSYTKQEKEELKEKQADIYNQLASLMDRDPSDPAVQAQVERWYRMINDTWYTCPPEMFRNLGSLYIQDPRFQKNIDKVRPGLSEFKQKAMEIFADRLIAERERSR